MHKLPLYPFDPQRCIGSVLEVTPGSAKANFPRAATPEGQSLHGNRIGAGEVGEFVFIEGGALATLGRVISVHLPERERLTVEPELGKKVDAHPLGTIRFLASINTITGIVESGITYYPRLGSRVFSAHPSLVAWIAESHSRLQKEAKPLQLHLAFLPDHANTSISILPENLFGRHCAVLGATGGGKSWTVARLIEEVRRFDSKVLLLDATGEYFPLRGDDIEHIYFGHETDKASGSTEVVMPYRNLTEQDLFAIFTPSGQTQLPKLRGAMKSLKVARLVPSLAPSGYIVKANQSRIPFEQAYRNHISQIESPSADFDIDYLVAQINEECVWPTDKYKSLHWGGYSDNEKGYCVSLMSRIESAIHAPELACIFKPGEKRSAIDAIEAFFSNPKKKLLRISLRNVSFSWNAREVLANAIGRRLLVKARENHFASSPAIIFLDEAHQFLAKFLGDEITRFALDSFELIAKEGRKYSLCICLSTQRPRDIPEGVLSQMGAMIVHRLTNDKDRDVVERACSSISRSMAEFLPSLMPGEALLLGTDFPFPVTLQMHKPIAQPDSSGPNYQRYWRDETPKSAVDS